MSARLPATAIALLVLAGAIVLVDVVLAVLGGRAATSVLTGTDPGSGDRALLGGLYILSHLGAVVVAPVFAIAAAIRMGLQRVISEKGDEP